MTSSTYAEDAIAHAVWMQWRAMGVHTASAPARRLIDPEALLIESAIVADRTADTRIADGAISWAVQHHDLIITARLKALLKRYDEAQRDAFYSLSRHVSDNTGRLSWPAAERAGQWTPSTDVKLPLLADHSELLRLRARALFGANARAEAVAFLTSVGPAGTDLAVIEQATSFSKRHLAGPLEQLVEEGSVERWWLGNRQQFRLSDRALEFLGYPTNAPALATGPLWIDWQRRFELARSCGRALDDLTSSGTVLALAQIRAQAEQLQRNGLHPPQPLRIDEDPEDRRDEIAQWIPAAIAQLTAV